MRALPPSSPEPVLPNHALSLSLRGRRRNFASAMPQPVGGKLMELIIPKAPEPRPPMNEAPHGLWSDDELDAEDLINLIPTVDERPPSRSTTTVPRPRSSRTRAARSRACSSSSPRARARTPRFARGARRRSREQRGESDDDDRAADDRRRRRPRRRPAAPQAAAARARAAPASRRRPPAAAPPRATTTAAATRRTRRRRRRSRWPARPRSSATATSRPSPPTSCAPSRRRCSSSPSSRPTATPTRAARSICTGSRSASARARSRTSCSRRPRSRPTGRARARRRVRRAAQPGRRAPPPPAGAGGAAPADGGGAGVDPLISEIGALLDDEFFDGPAWPEPRGRIARQPPPPPSARPRRRRRARSTPTRTLEQLVERNALAPLKCFPGADGRAVQLAQLRGARVGVPLAHDRARPSQKNAAGVAFQAAHPERGRRGVPAAGPARTVPPVRGNMAEKVLSRIFDEIADAAAPRPRLG